MSAIFVEQTEIKRESIKVNHSLKNPTIDDLCAFKIREAKRKGE